jgi:hypothetical protein
MYAKEIPIPAINLWASSLRRTFQQQHNEATSCSSVNGALRHRFRQHHNEEHRLNDEVGQGVVDDAMAPEAPHRKSNGQQNGQHCFAYIVTHFKCMSMGIVAHCEIVEVSDTTMLHKVVNVRTQNVFHARTFQI